MKNRHLFLLILAGGLAALPRPGRADIQTTDWNNTTSDWFSNGNWSNGVPGTRSGVDSNATINTGTAQISGAATSTFLSVGENPGNGALQVLSGGTLVVSSIISLGLNGAGTLTISNGATVTDNGSLFLANTASSSGTLNLNAGGLLQVGGDALFRSGEGASAFNFAGGTLQVVNANLTSSIDATLSGTTSTIDTNGFSAVMTGQLSGSGATAALTKSGAGTLTLSGASAYGGATTVSAGGLNIQSGGSVSGGDAEIGAGTGETAAVTVTGTTSSWGDSGNLTVGSASSSGNTLTITNRALVKLTLATATVSFGSDTTNGANALQIADGYFAWAGDHTADIASMVAGHSVYYLAGSVWVEATPADLMNGNLTVAYYSTAPAAMAATGGLDAFDGGYTILTAIPEPATYGVAFAALLGAVVLQRRRMPTPSKPPMASATVEGSGTAGV